jgi:predicted nucleic acid-binding protein
MTAGSGRVRAYAGLFSSSLRFPRDPQQAALENQLYAFDLAGAAANGCEPAIASYSAALKTDRLLEEAYSAADDEADALTPAEWAAAFEITTRLTRVGVEFAGFVSAADALIAELPPQTYGPLITAVTQAGKIVETVRGLSLSGGFSRASATDQVSSAITGASALIATLDSYKGTLGSFLANQLFGVFLSGFADMVSSLQALGDAMNQHNQATQIFGTSVLQYNFLLGQLQQQVSAMQAAVVACARNKPLGVPQPPVQSRCAAISISPNVVSTGEGMSAQAGPSVPAACYGSVTFTWYGFSGMSLVSGCLPDGPGTAKDTVTRTCDLKAVSVTGGWVQGCIDGGSGFGSWSSCEPYAVIYGPVPQAPGHGSVPEQSPSSRSPSLPRVARVASLTARPAPEVRNLVSNSNFALPAVATDQILPSGTQIAGWAVGPGQVELMSGAGEEPPPDGGQSMVLDDNGPGAAAHGAISQALKTVAGRSYMLGWYQAAGAPLCGLASRATEVLWDGKPVYTATFDPVGHMTSYMGWSLRRAVLTATSSASLLELRDASSGTPKGCAGSGAAIGEVTLSPYALLYVPSSAALTVPGQLVAYVDWADNAPVVDPGLRVALYLTPKGATAPMEIGTAPVVAGKAVLHLHLAASAAGRRIKVEAVLSGDGYLTSTRQLTLEVLAG